MTWAVAKDGRIQVRQQKTDTFLSVPMHTDLRRALDAAPRVSTHILTTEHGAPYKLDKYGRANGFGNVMRDWCDAAGLPDCASHGLRKAASRRLAEAGATDAEIMSVTGHRARSEVTRYRRGADQKRQSSAEILKLERTEDGS